MHYYVENTIHPNLPYRKEHLMKKLNILLLLFTLILLFTACSPAENDTKNSDISSNSNLTEDISPNGYTIETPIILSEANVEFADGTVSYRITLEMVDGRFYNGGDDDIYSTNYEGKVELCLYDAETDKEIYRIDAQSSSMLFSGKFELKLTDYNQDENPDFTLVQRDKENELYRIFKFYTITSDGLILEIPVPDLYALPCTITDFSVIFEILITFFIGKIILNSILFTLAHRSCSVKNNFF